jgi:hypothetical protein
MKKIYSVNVQIIDRGISYPLSKPIEVHPPIQSNIKKTLNKWRYSMDLSRNFKFKILSSNLVGYGGI